MLRKLFGGELSRFFAFKCLMGLYPVIIISLLTLTTTTLLAYVLRIFEVAPEMNSYDGIIRNHTEFHNIFNTLWYIYITFLTIGYGDYVPLTNPGRCIGIFTAVFGTMVYSILIVTIHGRFRLTRTEMNVIKYLTPRLLHLLIGLAVSK
jgi:hypothetical protein